MQGVCACLCEWFGFTILVGTRSSDKCRHFADPHKEIAILGLGLMFRVTIGAMVRFKFRDLGLGLMLTPPDRISQ